MSDPEETVGPTLSHEDTACESRSDETATISPRKLEPSPRTNRRPARMAPGERLGAFELDSHLGSGGMGDVYAAHHIETEERVALKVLSRTSPMLLYRFKREFRALADVSHRNLVSLRELVVPADGTAFFTMELLEGAPFVEYVRRRARPQQLPNLVRLSRAFRQLVEGVMRLHAAGCVHRDLKPSNLLVSRDGRVVVLDFGLVSEQTEFDDRISRDGQLLGTPPYMAPEQAGFGPISGATDYYAIGVLLYECLTGQLPFRGPAMEMLLRKQNEDAPDPRELVSGIPVPLRDLCLRLLAREPERRPHGEELLSHFAVESMPGESTGLRRNREIRAPFIGRAAELAALDQALADVRDSGSAVTVHVHGASGHGKTALLNHFLGKVRNNGDALILRGRCLERESVPYKGVDAVVDSLSAHLRRRSENETAGYKPRHLGPLAQIFPVLGDLWTLKGVPIKRFEPAEQRRLGLAALREILARLADERPLVIHIDDFQWADMDGASLLGSLVRPPDPPAMLLLVSFRETAEGERSDALVELTSAESRLGRDIRELQVEALTNDEARELALRLLELEQGTRESEVSIQQRADSFARSSRGNPFYIGQMVLNDGTLSESGTGTTGDGDDRIVARRITALAPEIRHFLAAVALAGGPTPMAVMNEIYDKLTSAEHSWVGELGTLDGIIEHLSELGLISRREELDSHDSASSSGGKISVGGKIAMVDVAHGRIREVTISELETEEVREIHLELATALEAVGGKDEALAEHFEHAGEFARAADYTERAAKQAAESLAFARAVQLYRRTLELLDRVEQAGDDQNDEARRHRLRVALAKQLINFGRSSEAGRLLRELADEVPPEQKLHFQRQAAEQLLHAGHVVEGLELAGLVLRQIGEAPPRSFWGSMLSFMWGRVRLGLRGRKFAVRPEAEIPAAQLEHIDTLMTIWRGLVLHLEHHAFVLHNRLVRLTLDAGEPRRLGIMLANEMTIIAAFGGQGNVQQLSNQARELASRVNDVELDRVIDFQHDMVEYSLNRFRDATDQLCELLPKLDDVPGADWIRFSSVLVYSSLCVITGRWRELDRNVPQWLAMARERGNLREIVELEAYAGMTQLHRGQLEQARYHYEAGRLAWDSSRYTYTTMVLDRTEIFLALAEGNIERALELLDKLVRAVKDSSLALNPVVVRTVDQLEGRCWSLACVHAPHDTSARARVRKVARRLRKSKISLYIGEAALAEAALASLSDAPDKARGSWREAEQLFGEQGIECHLAAVRWQLSRVTEGDEARELAGLAAEYFENHGVGDPQRFSNMLVPAHAKV